MPDKKQLEPGEWNDEWGERPTDGYLIDHWWQRSKAGEEAGMSPTGILLAGKRGAIKCVKIEIGTHGIWLFEPESVKSFKKAPSGRKPDTEN